MQQCRGKCSEFISGALDAAQEFAQRGWPVLPLKAGEKAPLSEAGPNGHKNASTEINLIGVWWSSLPRVSIR
ncbi:MAG: bifunctional DNA primase/polymerase [Halobacteriota archaeon]